MWYNFEYDRSHPWYGLEKKVICPICLNLGVRLETQNSAHSYGLTKGFRTEEPDRAVCPNCGVVLDHEIILGAVAKKRSRQPA